MKSILNEIDEINEFINSCDKDFYNEVYNKNNIYKARIYLKMEIYSKLKTFRQKFGTIFL